MAPVSLDIRTQQARCQAQRTRDASLAIRAETRELLLISQELRANAEALLDPTLKHVYPAKLWLWLAHAAQDKCPSPPTPPPDFCIGRIFREALDADFR